MPFQVSPGVNVSEIDLTTVVPAVSTTEGAFAGQFRWGPVEQRVLVDTEDRLVNIFQKPTSDNAEDFFTAANFLSYGNQLYVVRVVDTTTGDVKNATTNSANTQQTLVKSTLGIKSVLMGFGLDSDAIHSPNEHYGLFNYYKGIETIPYFFKYYTELAKEA
jgi:hypothetical protein